MPHVVLGFEHAPGASPSLDAQDVRAHVGQHLRAERPRPDASHFDNPYSLKRPHRYLLVCCGDSTCRISHVDFPVSKKI
jgi:hypothetical protein